MRNNLPGGGGNIIVADGPPGETERHVLLTGCGAEGVTVSAGPDSGNVIPTRIGSPEKTKASVAGGGWLARLNS